MFQVYTGVKFISLNEPEDDMGWHAKLQVDNNEIDHAAEDQNILVKNEIDIQLRPVVFANCQFILILIFSA